ncbi:MAG: UbiD family decarboxylase [Candidatus Binataceae bacterium]
MKESNSSGCADDLREFIDRLEAHDELRRVSAEVDWRYEIGAMSRLVCEKRGPAPLFENVKDYPGHRVAAVLIGPSKPALHARTALGLGFEDKQIPPLEMIEIVRQRIKQSIPPVTVAKNEAPCKEVILKGDDANLLKFPAPWIKEIDGGRYIGTWDVFITKDPDTGWVNWGTYRSMLKDEKHFVSLLMPSGHGGQALLKYEAKGKPMPIALVIGADPVSHLVAGSSFERGVSEASAAGALRGEPVRVVKCETSDLEVPATAEIVIEAEVIPGRREDEGPFGEFTGHAAQRGKAPLLRVNCITHRRDPIFTVANMGKPWDDNAVSTYIVWAACAKNWLENLGIEINSLYYYAPNLPVISLKPRAGLQQKIVSAMLAGHRRTDTGIVFVDEDVDVTNVEDVFWAIASRMRPSNYEVIRNIHAMPLTAWLSPEERAAGKSEMFVMDATLPYEWPQEYREAHTRVADFNRAWSGKMKDTVLNRWREYGYGDVE